MFVDYAGRFQTWNIPWSQDPEPLPKTRGELIPGGIMDLKEQHSLCFLGCQKEKNNLRQRHLEDSGQSIFQQSLVQGFSVGSGMVEPVKMASID